MLLLHAERLMNLRDLEDYYCICFVCQHSIEGYEYEFEREDFRCNKELPPSLLEHVRTVSMMHNHKELNNRKKKRG